MILSAKRNLGDTVVEGVKEIGLLIDPMEDTFLRRLYEKGLRDGEEAANRAKRQSCCACCAASLERLPQPANTGSIPRLPINWNDGATASSRPMMSMTFLREASVTSDLYPHAYSVFPHKPESTA